MNSMIEQILKPLDDFGIPYCILHGWQFPHENPSSDLDIIVPPEHLDTLERALSTAENVKIVQLLQYETSGYYFVLAIRRSGDIRFMAVDAATDYRLGGSVFFTAAELMQERYRWRNIWVASTAVEFKYLLVKKIMKGDIRENQAKRLEVLADELGDEGISAVHDLFGQRSGNELISLIRNREMGTSVTRFANFRKALIRKNRKKKALGVLQYWVPELDRISRRLRHPTGFFVAVLGPDGSGKSALIRNLRQNLTTPFRRYDTFHLRPGILGKNRVRGPVSDPHGKPPRGLFLSLLKLPYFFFDYGIGYLCHIRLKLIRSSLVLFDRYYDDMLVDPVRYRYGGPRFPVRLFQHLIPKPDLYIVLDVTEDLLRQRKQEVFPEELKRQRKAYRRLAQERPNAVVLDGSLPQADVFRHARERILDFLSHRYSLRRSLWFQREKSESINRLSRILFAPDENMNSGARNIIEPVAETPSIEGVSFRWFQLKDGRGYLIPEGPKRSSRNALKLYNPRHRRGRIARNLLALGLRTGIAQQLLPRISLPVVPGGASLLSHIRRIMGQQDLTFAVSLGTPGPHRKPVMQMFDESGRIQGYLKIGWNEATNDLVRHEAEILRSFEGVSIDSVLVPRVLYSGWWRDRFLCIQSTPDGVRQGGARTGMMKDRMDPFMAAITAMKGMYVDSSTFSESVFRTEILRRMDLIRNSCHGHLLYRGMKFADRLLGTQPLPFHLCHGDFTPWNACQVKGRLFLFDWEYASVSGFPGLDLIHFMIKRQILIENRSPTQVYESFRSRGTAGVRVRKYLQGVGLDEDMRLPLLLGYLLERFSFRAALDAENYSVLNSLVHLIELCLMEEEIT